MEGRMDESASMADWVLERESDGEDAKGVGSDEVVGLLEVSEVGLSLDIEKMRKREGNTKKDLSKQKLQEAERV